MKEQVSARIEQLRAEYDKGRATVEELEAKLQSVRSTMLRISGAIQVLEELLQEEAKPAGEQAPEVPRLRVPA